MTHSRSRELHVLATCGWLVETPAVFRNTLLEGCLVRRYRRGDVVYRAGDPPGGLFGLIEGGVGVELSPSDREPYIVTFARPGFWIGEGSVLTRGPRFIGIRATRDSVLAYLSIARWDVIARGDPDAWRWFAHLALSNTLLAMAVAEALMIPGAARRMAAILLILSSQHPPPDAATSPAIDVCQEDLARMANLSRSSTGRILQAFEADGLIESGYRQVRVVDHDGLREHRSGQAGSLPGLSVRRVRLAGRG